jgi:hypothetical protein
METDEQKDEIKESNLSQRYKLDVSNVFSTIGLRSFIQNTLRRHWELLGYRYHILLLIRGILAGLLAINQIL